MILSNNNLVHQSKVVIATVFLSRHLDALKTLSNKYVRMLEENEISTVDLGNTEDFLERRMRSSYENYCNFYYSSLSEFLLSVLRDVDDNLNGLPPILMEDIKLVIFVMSRRLLDWCYKCKLDFKLFPPIFWTHLGTIDEDKTMTFIQNEYAVDCNIRHQIALYCSHSDVVAEQWKFVHFPPSSSFIRLRKNNNIRYQYMLELALWRSPNLMGVKYFWKKLSPDSRKNFLQDSKMQFEFEYLRHPMNYEIGDVFCRFFWDILNESEREMVNKGLLPYLCCTMLLQYPLFKYNEYIQKNIKALPFLRKFTEFHIQILEQISLTNIQSVMRLFHRADVEMYHQSCLLLDVISMR